MDKHRVVDAAVIVLHEQDTDSLILTKRSPHLREHPGEICFPGGLWEEGDKTLDETGLRELKEELGIDSKRIQLQKKMKTELTLSGYLIHPWLASIDTLLPYELNAVEVVEIVRLPMSDVYELVNYKEMLVTRMGEHVKTYQFIHKEHFVWGATARIMMQLAGKVKV